jgi:DNA-binding transcriptional MocR family regulator
VALSLAFGLPDPGLFPTEAFAEATARILSDTRVATTALQYGPIKGYPPLLEMLAARLNATEGPGISTENLLITNGSSGAIGLAARLLLDDGDTVLVEAPSFVGAMSILRYSGAKLVPVQMGEDGLDLAVMGRTLEDMARSGVRPKALYTMPTFHNPTGLTSPEAARRTLLELAHRFDFMIIEDDAYRDLYYDVESGSLPPSLYSLDTEGRVIRTGTFSKTLAPGLRLGWALAQPVAVDRMMLLKEEGGTSPFSQAVAAEFGRDGAFETHVERLVEAYRAKRDAMLSALERHFPPQARWTRPTGGFFVWVALLSGVDSGVLASSAREEGVDYMRGERCFAGTPEPGNPTHLRLAFSALGLDEIEESVKRLGRAVKGLVG